MGLPNISTGEIIFKSGNFVFLKGQFLMDVSTLVHEVLLTVFLQKDNKISVPVMSHATIFSRKMQQN